MRLLASAALTLSALPLGVAWAQDEDLIAAMERRTSELAREAGPAVVSVTAVTHPQREPRQIFPGLVLEPQTGDAERLEATGFLVAREGLVATTSELAREPASFVVRLADGVEREAWLLGTDEVFRVAILRIDAPKDGKAIERATSLDTSGRRFGWLVTASSSGREVDAQLATVREAACPDTSYDRLLATSVRLDAGSAGAPLLARDGTLLGMAIGAAGVRAAPTVAMDGRSRCRTTLFVRGDDVLAAAATIAREGRVRRARIGVLLDGDTSRVEQLLPGGPAELVGLRDGDEIVGVAGTPVANAASVTRALLRRRPGDAVPVDVRRSGEVRRFRLTLDDVELPPLPQVPPLEGAVLGMTARRSGAGEGAEEDAISFREVAPESALAAAGAAAGDRLVSVDGMEARRFVMRHRVRPSPSPPLEVVVLREGAEVRLSLRRDVQSQR